MALSPLPRISGIPASTYEHLIAPLTIEDGRLQLDNLLIRIDILTDELEVGRMERHQLGEGVIGQGQYRAWRHERVLERLRLRRQTLILKVWLHNQGHSEYATAEARALQQSVAGVIAPMVTLLLSANPVEKVQARANLFRRFEALMPVAKRR